MPNRELKDFSHVTTESLLVLLDNFEIYTCSFKESSDHKKKKEAARKEPGRRQPARRPISPEFIASINRIDETLQPPREIPWGESTP